MTRGETSFTFTNPSEHSAEQRAAFDRWLRNYKVIGSLFAVCFVAVLAFGMAGSPRSLVMAGVGPSDVSASAKTR